MKKTIIATLLATALASNVFAKINVPFTNEAVPTEGLTVTYNTNDTQKVHCTTYNFYKGYLWVTENGLEKDTGIVYGNYDNDEFYFTSVGNDESTDNAEQVHVDKKGRIKFADTHYDEHQAYLSCSYEPETNSQ